MPKILASHLNVLVTLSSLLLLAGCEDKQARQEIAELKGVRAELAELKESLVNTTLVRARPKLEVEIVSMKIHPTSSLYNAQWVEVTGLVRQVGAFVHPAYEVGVALAAEHKEFREESEIAVANVREGSGTFFVSIPLYSAALLDIKGLTPESLGIAITSSYWRVPADSAPDVTLVRQK